jgi:hypothetical protein
MPATIASTTPRRRPSPSTRRRQSTTPAHDAPISRKRVRRTDVRQAPGDAVADFHASARQTRDPRPKRGGPRAEPAVHGDAGLLDSGRRSMTAAGARASRFGSGRRPRACVRFRVATSTENIATSSSREKTPARDASGAAARIRRNAAAHRTFDEAPTTIVAAPRGSNDRRLDQEDRGDGVHASYFFLTSTSTLMMRNRSYHRIFASATSSRRI